MLRGAGHWTVYDSFLTVLAKELQEILFYSFVYGINTAVLFEVFNIYYIKAQTQRVRCCLVTYAIQKSHY